MTGRRADDIETVLITSGRRASDAVKTFGLMSMSNNNNNRGCFTTIALMIGWFVLFSMLISFLASCCWMSILFS